jgi:large subunit ribosomal protein L10
LKRQEKEAFVSEMREKLAVSPLVLLTDYRGLSAEKMNELRVGFRKADIHYRVVKNNLLRRAAKDTELFPVVESLVGPTGVIASNADPVLVSKIVKEFLGKYQAFTYKTGVLGGKILSEKDIEIMSKLPGREVLLAQLLGTLNSVPTGLVQVFAGILSKLLYALVAIKEAKEKGN